MVSNILNFSVFTIILLTLISSAQAATGDDRENIEEKGYSLKYTGVPGSKIYKGSLRISTNTNRARDDHSRFTIVVFLTDPGKRRIEASLKITLD